MKNINKIVIFKFRYSTHFNNADFVVCLLNILIYMTCSVARGKLWERDLLSPQ